MVGGVVSSVRRGDGGGAVGITEPNQHADLNTDGGGTGDDDVLTTRQRAILDVIISHVNERGFPPSMREIGETVGLRSPASVKFHLDNLQNAGYLKRDPVKPRSIQVNYGGVPTTDTSNGVSCRDSDESWSLGTFPATDRLLHRRHHKKLPHHQRNGTLPPSDPRRDQPHRGHDRIEVVSRYSIKEAGEHGPRRRNKGQQRVHFIYVGGCRCDASHGP